MRSDICHYAADTEVVQPFQKKIVVQALGCLLADKVHALGKRGIKYGHITKRDIGCGKVKMIQVMKPAILVTGNLHFCFRVEVRKDFTSQEVFFITDYIRVR